MLTDDKLDDVLRFVRSEILRQRSEGRLRLYLGVQGQVALLLDRLQRWFENPDEEVRMAELSGLAVDALVVFSLAIPDVEVDMAEIRRQAELQNHREQLRVQSLAMPDSEEDQA